MRICIDVDGTICESRKPEQSYEDVVPTPGAPETIRRLKEQGHVIILQTARHMKTCQGNTGQVVARQGKTLMLWLEKHDIPYDEIWFGKPYAEVYIDDNVLPFRNNWSEIETQIGSGKVGLGHSAK